MVSIEGLIYLLNQSGIALAQANEQITQLHNDSGASRAEAEQLTVSLDELQAEVEFLRSQEPYALKATWESCGADKTLREPTRVALVTLDGRPHPALEVAEYVCDPTGDDLTITYTVVRKQAQSNSETMSQ